MAEKKTLEDLKIGDPLYWINYDKKVEQKGKVDYLKLDINNNNNIYTNNYYNCTSYPKTSIMYNNYYINKEDAEEDSIVQVKEQIKVKEKLLKSETEKLNNLINTLNRLESTYGRNNSITL
jgi:hypothetical protein